MTNKIKSNKIIGLGHSLGSIKVNNEELSKLIDLPAEYIQKVTGISNRYWCDTSKENLYVNMASAVDQALHSANLNLENIDEIITISNHSADFLLPNTASMLAATLGLEKIKAHSVATGCAGGVVGLGTAHNQLIVDYLQGKEKTIAVVAGDQTSKILAPNSKDKSLFTDSASCLLVTNKPSKNYFFGVEKTDHLTILNNFMALNQKNGEFVNHDGPKVYNFVSRNVSKIIKELEGRTDFSDTYIIPHQPSGRTLKNLSNQFNAAGMYLEGVSTIGNSSPASTFIGLEDAIRKSLIDVDKVSLISFGEGLTVSYASLKKGPTSFLPDRLQDDVLNQKHMSSYKQILAQYK